MFDTAKKGTACLILGSEDMFPAILDLAFVGTTLWLWAVGGSGAGRGAGELCPTARASPAMAPR